MKHGNKKGKAKAPSGKKSKPAPKGKDSQASGAKKSSTQAAAPRPVSKGDKARGGGDPFSFNNPVVASAFRRAVKKYPSAFKRLTD